MPLWLVLHVLWMINLSCGNSLCATQRKNLPCSKELHNFLPLPRHWSHSTAKRSTPPCLQLAIVCMIFPFLAKGLGIWTCCLWRAGCGGTGSSHAHLNIWNNISLDCSAQAKKCQATKFPTY